MFGALDAKFNKSVTTWLNPERKAIIKSIATDPRAATPSGVETVFSRVTTGRTEGARLESDLCAVT